ncbi:MAG TPA: hypothetical protein VJG30_04535 [Candidatus Nanoarchaeia archaeon]|nr:hypothetical protein [Candidatus Nanoarchaeia archaeon]
MEYHKLLEELTEEGIEYLAIGGVAIVLTGYIRDTIDLDLFVNLEDSNLKKVIDFFTKKGYVPMVPVAMQDILNPENRRRWYEEKGMKAFMMHKPDDPFSKVGLLIYSGGVEFEAAYQRRQTVRTDKIKIFIAPIDDLIELKKSTGRDKDLVDLKILRKLKEQKDE